MVVYLVTKKPFGITKYYNVNYIEDALYLGEQCYAINYSGAGGSTATYYAPKSIHEIMIEGD